MSDTRPPLVSDELLAMHAQRAESDWGLVCRVREEYESLITSGHLRRVGEPRVWTESEVRAMLRAIDVAIMDERAQMAIFYTAKKHGIVIDSA